ncbi:MAG: hypothetical protein IKH84_03230 [Ottowia sp.]|nr:hypothetical protein [Ottowia sp.]
MIDILADALKPSYRARFVAAIGACAMLGSTLLEAFIGCSLCHRLWSLWFSPWFFFGFAAFSMDYRAVFPRLF